MFPKNMHVEVEEWLPHGFEERTKENNRGMVVRGWVHQELILKHVAIGGFLTQCGWNSVTEGISAGVPLITMPRFAEQFLNEKLVTEVHKIGVEVGECEWSISLKMRGRLAALVSSVREQEVHVHGDEKCLNNPCYSVRCLMFGA